MPKPEEKKKAGVKSPKPGKGGERTPREMLNGREIIYPKKEVLLCEGADAITVAQAKELLKWEDEEATIVRLKESQPDLSEEAIKKIVNDSGFLLTDEHKKRINCWNNTRNRPFSETWARELAQDILNREWQFNMENIIISCTGLVLSGQHRLIGLILAAQIWAGAGKEGTRKKEHWKEMWDSEPYIESTVARGASEDPRVLQTYDNVKTRTLSDVFYTSPFFQNLNAGQKKECSRMLEAGTKLLWKRTQAGSEDSFLQFLTHSAGVDFVHRHEKLLEYVRFLYDLNVMSTSAEEDEEEEDGEKKKRGSRAISQLGVSAGECAALCYMMASASTDVNLYVQDEPQDRSEKHLTWEYEDKAKEFWTLIANGSYITKAVKDGIDQLVDPGIGGGGGGRGVEKRAIIALGWAAFLDLPDNSEEAIAEEAVTLTYDEDRDGLPAYVERPTVGGIDLGDPKRKKKDDPTKEQIEAGKAAEREERLIRDREKILEDRERRKDKAFAEGRGPLGPPTAR